MAPKTNGNNANNSSKKDSGNSQPKSENNPQSKDANIREDVELNAAAVNELSKLRRQLRQLRIDIQIWQRRENRQKQRHLKEIQSLENQEKWLKKLKSIKLEEKPPRDLKLIVERWNQTRDQMLEAKTNLQEAQRNHQKILKLYEELRLKKTSKTAETLHLKADEDKLEQVTTQYNKLLSKNSEIRQEIEEVLQEKSRFTRKFKDLCKKRSQVRSLLDRLYEESTTAFQEREELRIKINLLREKMETTKLQSQREILEYRRLVNNDEKIQKFLATKNQLRGLVEEQEESKETNAEDDNWLQDFDEWRSVLEIQLGQSDFDILVEQYLTDLEQCHVMYGLVAQRNSEYELSRQELVGNEKQSDAITNQSEHLTRTNQVEQPIVIKHNSGDYDKTILELSMTKLEDFLKILDLQHLLQAVYQEDETAAGLERLKLGFTLLLDRVTELLTKK